MSSEKVVKFWFDTVDQLYLFQPSDNCESVTDVAGLDRTLQFYICQGYRMLRLPDTHCSLQLELPF